MRKRLLRLSSAAIALLVFAGACSSDPTASDEYEQLSAEKSVVEAQLNEAEGARDDASSRADEAAAARDEALAAIDVSNARADGAEATVAELEASVSEAQARADGAEATVVELEASVSEAQARADDTRAELDTWIAFVGDTDEPFTWSQELFDASVLTCMVDGSSEADCRCLLEVVEEEVSLLDLMFGTELIAAAELGLIEFDPVTELPEGFPIDLALQFGSAFFTCFI